MSRPTDQSDTRPNATADSRGVLHNRPFMAVWGSQAVSSFGDPLQAIALAFVVIDRGAGPLALSAVVVAIAVPRGIAALFAGPLVDRHGALRIVVLSDAVRAAASAVLAVLVLINAPIWTLIPGLVVTGLAGGAFRPAIQASVPVLVDRDKYQSANSLTQLNPQVAMMVGAPLAGLAVAVLGKTASLSLNAGTFLLAAVVSEVVRRAVVVADEGPPEDEETLLRAFLVGLRHLALDRGLGLLILLDGVVDLATAGQLSVGLPLISNQLGGAVALGWLLAGFGAGSVISLLAMVLVPRLSHRGLLICLLQLPQAALLALVPFLSLPLSSAALFGMALLNGVCTVLFIALIQERTPERMLGRVLGLSAVAGFTLQPVGQVATGAIASVSTAANTFLFSACIVAAVSTLGALSSKVRAMD